MPESPRTQSISVASGRLASTVESGIGWITFDNPSRRNAVSLAMWKSLPEILLGHAADPAVRVIVLRGAGDKAFVAGADISEFGKNRTGVEQAEKYNVATEQADAALRDCPKPTIAMIQGFCMGGGVAIAVACDIRIAAEDACFSSPAARLGVGYRFSGIERLVQVVGTAAAAEMFFTARQFNAQEASRLRLVDHIVPSSNLMTFTAEYAASIVRNAPLTLRAVKRCLIESVRDPASRDLRLCQELIDACFASADYREGQAAFLEKRPPKFNGT